MTLKKIVGKMKGGFTLLLLLSFLFTCNPKKINTSMIHQQAPVIIYKTQKDYYHNVPVVLNDEKNSIISFPGPGDLLYDGEPALPVKLKKGYLLDRRGMSPNSAFTAYTYDEYAQLSMPPPVQDLYESIIDMDPFEEYYDCGSREKYSDDLIDDLNRLIKADFKGCNRLK